MKTLVLNIHVLNAWRSQGVNPDKSAIFLFLGGVIKAAVAKLPEQVPRHVVVCIAHLLTHGPWNEMAHIWQTTIQNTISLMKMFVFWFKLHQS